VDQTTSCAEQSTDKPTFCRRGNYRQQEELQPPLSLAATRQLEALHSPGRGGDLGRLFLLQQNLLLELRNRIAHYTEATEPVEAEK